VTTEPRIPQTPSFRLDGRRALVTGGSRGIGFAASAALAQAGAAVVLVSNERDEIVSCANALRSIGAEATGHYIDITDLSAVREFVASEPPFDILFNNAGINRPVTFTDVTIEDFDAIMGLNVRSAFFVAQAVARRLIAADRGGSIINTSSQMGLVGAAIRSVYCASKHAVVGMTKAMAIDLAPARIRVNALCPTFIETPFTRPFFEDAAFRTAVLARIKLGRIGVVEDLMGAIVFLASDAAGLMTGSALTVDGGWTAG
jgi:NAD(P)-dependent dehydrogenase (short-subunit alcohol dehydrogenase family)